MKSKKRGKEYGCKKPSLKGMANTGYLGHFAQDKFIQQGHNDSGSMPIASEKGIYTNVAKGTYSARAADGTIVMGQTPQDVKAQADARGGVHVGPYTKEEK